MTDRLSSIVTKTGDAGTTSLADGSRVRKNDLRIDTMGHIDELNSIIGLCIAQLEDSSVHAKLLLNVQHVLFNAGSELAVPGYIAVTETSLAQLDDWVLIHNAKLPSLREFILPGGSLASAHVHVARTVARRAERAWVGLAEFEALNGVTQKYLNRLSDVLFILARLLNLEAGVADVFWQRES